MEPTIMTVEQGALKRRAAATANSIPAAAGAAGDYLTNEQATEMLRGANSGVKPELGRRIYRVVKRTVDIVAAGGALVLLFIPRGNSERGHLHKESGRQPPIFAVARGPRAQRRHVLPV